MRHIRRFIHTLVPFALVGFVGAAACEKKAEPTATPATNDGDGAATAENPTTTNAAESPDDRSDGAVDVIKTAKGEVKVMPLQHASVVLKHGEKVIVVDPVSPALAAGSGGNPDSLPKADLVLVTHTHGDHLDTAAIAKLRKEGAPAVVAKTVAEKAGDALPNPTVMVNGDKTTAAGYEIEAVPAYNIERKRDDGTAYHPQGDGNGYIITIDGTRIYLSGDTECVPEVKALTNIDAAFLCMNVPYTMPVEEAGACIKEFKPRAVFPYHYRDQDPSKLIAMFKDDAKTELRLLEWYP